MARRPLAVRARAKAKAEANQRQRRARLAEDAVAEHVTAAGMRILDRNLRVRQLELDIVAVDGDAVVVVEVRTRGRTSWAKALTTVDAKKRDRLRRAAKLLWARRFSKMPGINRMRFDVAAVDLDAPSPSVEYIRAAFT
jgi:putative endonuclease